jgi:tripartite-type tricarboxylate transporter receptor subunit TctC
MGIRHYDTTNSASLHLENCGIRSALTTPHLKAGKLNGLLNFGRKRAASLQDIPTAGEAGLTGVEALAWWGVFAPSGTSSSTVDRFAQLVAEILREEKNAKLLADAQLSLGLMGLKNLAAFANEQMRISMASC